MARKLQSPESDHTILVVDDQEEARVSTCQLLEREGHRVLTAASAGEALILYKENDVHLLLVDYFMPEMSGADLIGEIRAYDPFVQIIVQTGHAEEKPPRELLGALDIQGYHNKADGPWVLLLWVDAGLKAYRVVHCLRERERMQAELVASVSHELRTPLCVINGYSELLRDGAFGALPTTTTTPLEAVEYATRGLDDLFSDFLQYAKLEAGVLDVVPEWTVIGDVVDQLTRLADLLLRNKEVSFGVDADGAPAGLVTDPIKLLTILRSLVANAVKFTRIGSIQVRIDVAGEHVRFVVSDTGPGIRSDDIERIFEPFRQLDGPATRAHHGIGLGLALSRRLAQLLGGSLEVESGIGVGSSFTLALPGLAAHAPSDTPPAPPARRAA